MSTPATPRPAAPGPTGAAAPGPTGADPAAAAGPPGSGGTGPGGTGRARLRAIAFGVFYALSPALRRRLVRLLVPKYIVGAVALVRDAEAPPPGRLLLLRQPPGVGWGLPAGLLRRGEPPVVGCARELAEESGLVLDPDELTPATPNALIHTNGRWVDTVFEASVPASRVTLRADGAEVLEAAWHRLDALPPLTHPTARLLSYYGIGPYVDFPEVRA
jgi:ADP-ribose pyrophosphatase YjhB (NUDIX family)